MDKKIKSYNLRKVVIDSIHLNAVEDGRTDSDWLDRYLTCLLQNEAATKAVKPKAKSKVFTPPTLQEVKDYCNERLNFVDPQNFIDHYSANGWMRGKNKIKDWRACVRTWERNSKPKDQPLEYSEKTARNINTIGDWLNEQ